MFVYGEVVGFCWCFVGVEILRVFFVVVFYLFSGWKNRVILRCFANDLLVEYDGLEEVLKRCGLW